VYEWNTAQNEPIMILMLGLLESTLSKPNINIIILFQKKSIGYGWFLERQNHVININNGKGIFIYLLIKNQVR
jgi:hypothetical protein